MGWWQFYWHWIATAATSSWAIADGIAGVFAIIGGFIAWKFPRKGELMNRLIWMIPLGIFSVILIIALAVVPYSVYIEQESKIASYELTQQDLEQTITDLQEENARLREQSFALPDELLASSISDQRIRVCDLAREDFIIKNKVFEDCDFFGPIMIHFSSSSIVDCHIEGNASAALVETTNETITGVVEFENCILRNCRLWHIGIIGFHDEIEYFRSVITIENDTNE